MSTTKEQSVFLKTTKMEHKGRGNQVYLGNNNSVLRRRGYVFLPEFDVSHQNLDLDVGSHIIFKIVSLFGVWQHLVQRFE